MNRAIHNALRKKRWVVRPKDVCPLCRADLTGAPIPEKDRHLFGNHTHFSRRIGIYDYDLDSTVQWQCPSCGGQWSRKGDIK